MMASRLLAQLDVIGDFLVELRYSARSLLRSPALTIALVLTIALGIASNASVDGFVRQFLANLNLVQGVALSH